MQILHSKITLADLVPDHGFVYARLHPQLRCLCSEPHGLENTSHKVSMLLF